MTEEHITSRWRSAAFLRFGHSSRITLVVVVLSILILSGCQSSSPAAPVMQPPEVEIAEVAQKDVSIHSEWVATIDGSVNAQIQPQVTGYLIKQNYKEGSFVRKGDILFEIDPRPFQAILDQAKGQLAQAESQVLQAESQVVQSNAQLGKAELDVRRDTPLVQARAIPQSQLDTEIQAKAAAEAGLQAAKAAVATSKAAVEASRASVAQAELNLGFTQVRSLVDGIAGVAQLQIGNLVNAQSVLTAVSQVNPIRVYFPISEQEYLNIAGKIKPGAVGDLLRSSDSVPLELILTNGTVYPHKGRVIFADRNVDSQTGTIRIAGAFPNPGNILRPGQFGRVRALTSIQVSALLIPQKAVTELQGQYQVAVVGPENKVHIQNVKLGTQFGTDWVVQDGLKVGQKVVTDGLMKVGEGAPVRPISSSKQSGGK